METSPNDVSIILFTEKKIFTLTVTLKTHGITKCTHASAATTKKTSQQNACACT